MNEQVSRNLDRFPEDFAFQLTQQEFTALMSQNAISKRGRGGRWTLPDTFTGQAAVVAAIILWRKRSLYERFKFRDGTTSFSRWHRRSSNVHHRTSSCAGRAGPSVARREAHPHALAHHGRGRSCARRRPSARPLRRSSSSGMRRARIAAPTSGAPTRHRATSRRG